jgi:glutamate/aspartate transport system substrate-binding protein
MKSKYWSALKTWWQVWCRTALVWFIGLFAPAVLAQGTHDTLVRVQQTGRIVLGAHDSSMPLSYLDANGRHIGYHMDVCMRIVEALRLKLDLPSIQVITVPTSAATRLALLNNGSIDIECAHNPVRSAALAQALLSHSTLLAETRLMSTRALPDLNLAALGGRTVGVVGGGSAVAALRLLARKHGVRINEQFGRGAADTFGLLDSNRVDAVAFPVPFLLAQRALSAEPGRFVLVDGVLVTEPLALMFRLNDEELHALANEVLAGMMRSGEMERLYDKWFNRVIPGLSQPLGLPLPEQMRLWFQAPGSEMLHL